jgi:hypothetical protein
VVATTRGIAGRCACLESSHYRSDRSTPTPEPSATAHVITARCRRGRG